ncbi:rRNA methyltransferase [Ignicoccus islandicus DSM 13165]|uniref:rRNA methyltransferase n=1 Tax=Ignicoccus islandicus DSM 13165 TaxID=940295 RepID=A0A0U2U591_9CREN|nr:TrmH family RNA methyltransferase [Ignicoccus islandicus]ALU11348.1 rRNA methyltransferase [Ignicoccus islandicus DSM 13165]
MKVRVVLVEPEGMINFGFIVRLSKNFEIDEIAVVNPKFDPFDEEVKRFAAQGVNYLSKVKIYNTVEEALEGFKVCTSAKVSHDDPLRQHVLPWELKDYIGDAQIVSLVFGRESVGLRRDELEKCDILMHIPASSSYPVLNLSHAVAITLYEFWKQFKLERGTLPSKPSEEDVNLFKLNLANLAETFIKDEMKRSRIIRLLENLAAKSTRSELRALIYFLGKCKRAIEEKCH